MRRITEKLTGFLAKSTASMALINVPRMSFDSALRTLSKFLLVPTNSSGKLSVFIREFDLAVDLRFKMSSLSVSVKRGTLHLPTTCEKNSRLEDYLLIDAEIIHKLYL